MRAIIDSIPELVRALTPGPAAARGPAGHVSFSAGPRDYPVMVTWDHEADARIGQSGTPAEFVAAWRHVHDVFQQQGAANVVWVWDLTGDGFLTSTASAMYPGDAYVDWTAADAYD